MSYFKIHNPVDSERPMKIAEELVWRFLEFEKVRNSSYH